MKLLSATISPTEALNKALIDEKGYFNHQKLTNMARLSTNGPTFKSFHNHNQIKKEPSLNIERRNACMKCGNPFTKGHINVCPAKDITCKNCNYNGHFAKLCTDSNKRPTVNTVNDNYVNTENFKYVSPESSWGRKSRILRCHKRLERIRAERRRRLLSTKHENYLWWKRAGNQETAKIRLGMGDDRKYEYPGRLSKPCKLFETKRVARAWTKIPQTENLPSGEAD